MASTTTRSKKEVRARVSAHARGRIDPHAAGHVPSQPFVSGGVAVEGGQAVEGQAVGSHPLGGRRGPVPDHGSSLPIAAGMEPGRLRRRRHSPR